MDIKTINTIKSKMETSLLPEQLTKLENVLMSIYLAEAEPEKKLIDNKSLILKFISSKIIEGCSKRTEEYYKATLFFYEKNIKLNICFVDTNEIRDYLINYQKNSNCSNVTLDTIRRILSSFYKWLEEEDFILKSPMKCIHRIKTPVVIKQALSEEQIELIRNTSSSNMRNLAIIDFFLSSGIRVSELIQLNRSSINLNTRSCIVFGKGSKQREIYFDYRTKIELENYLKTRKDKNKALFVSLHK